MNVNCGETKMPSVETLDKLVKSPDSGVFLLRHLCLHLAIHPRYLGNIKLGILAYLNKNINIYHSELEGILLGWNHLKLKTPNARLFHEEHHLHLDISAHFWVFRPMIGKNLIGIVNKKSSSHVTVLVHGLFNVPCYRPDNIIDWWGAEAIVGKPALVKVKKVDMTQKVPFIMGELPREGLEVAFTSAVSAGGDLADLEKMIEVTEEEWNVNGEEYDSGIDSNLVKKKDESAENPADETFSAEISEKKKKKKKDENAENPADETFSAEISEKKKKDENAENPADETFSAEISEKKKKKKKKKETTAEEMETTLDSSVLDVSTSTSKKKKKNKEEETEVTAEEEEETFVKKMKKKKKKEKEEEEKEEVMASLLSALNDTSEKKKKKKKKKDRENEDEEEKEQERVTEKIIDDAKEIVMKNKKRKREASVNNEITESKKSKMESPKKLTSIADFQQPLPPTLPPIMPLPPALQSIISNLKPELAKPAPANISNGPSAQGVQYHPAVNVGLPEGWLYESRESSTGKSKFKVWYTPDMSKSFRKLKDAVSFAEGKGSAPKTPTKSPAKTPIKSPVKTPTKSPAKSNSAPVESDTSALQDALLNKTLEALNTSSAKKKKKKSK